MYLQRDIDTHFLNVERVNDFKYKYNEVHVDFKIERGEVIKFHEDGYSGAEIIRSKMMLNYF